MPIGVPFLIICKNPIIIKKLSKVHTKYTTPHISIFAYASLCLLFSVSGE